jgi:hypothetical protein
MFNGSNSTKYEEDCLTSMEGTFYAVLGLLICLKNNQINISSKKTNPD